MSETVDCMVLGAGFVGLGAALALQERGRSVVLVDRLGSAAGETSFGNAGVIHGEAVYPYRFPRDPIELANAGLNRDPRAQVRHSALPALAPALWRYYRGSAREFRAELGRAQRALVEGATAEHRRLALAANAETLLRAGGWIKAFRTEGGRARAVEEAEEASGFGVKYRLLDREAMLALEPHLSEAAIGGVHYFESLTTPDPAALGAAYLKLFIERGGKMAKGDALSLEAAGEQWRVTAEADPMEARAAVVALGPWSDELARRFGYALPFFVKRGYHMHYSALGNAGLTRPVLDIERGYVVTPMTRGLRLTTGAEFARADDPPSLAHLDRLEPFARELFPLGERLDPAPWLGRRPCLPDMLPVIGEAPRHKGLWFDFGHQHLGLTLGPISGRLIADLMTGATPFVDPAPYALTRFG